jgi:thiazole synthase
MWEIGGKLLESRLFLGTALYPSLDVMETAIRQSGTQVVTVSLRRESPATNGGGHFLKRLQALKVSLLPNTAGCRSVQEAVTTAHMARELFDTNWIKLEIIGDEYNLQPDPFALVEAARLLVQDGFEVFPYTTDDLIVAKRLIDAGCRILMPWGAPIGTARGLINPYALRILRARLPNIPLIIDAGLGLPSHAAQVMELGFDGVLLNSAVALADEPGRMARAFALAVEAGLEAAQAGPMPVRDLASPSTPTVGQPFWHQQNKVLS